MFDNHYLKIIQSNANALKLRSIMKWASSPTDNTKRIIERELNVLFEDLNRDGLGLIANYLNSFLKSRKFVIQQSISVNECKYWASFTYHHLPFRILTPNGLQMYNGITHKKPLELYVMENDNLVYLDTLNSMEQMTIMFKKENSFKVESVTINRGNDSKFYNFSTNPVELYVRKM